jgi:hypothetical protein
MFKHEVILSPLEVLFRVKLYSLRPKKNDVLGFKICPERMTFYLIWHVRMCM